MTDIAWLPFQSWMNGSGTGGYFPNKEFLESFPLCSVFITNPISFQPRKPANNRCVIDYQGGFLVHTGWPNPGFYSVIRKYGKLWEKASIPIIINLLVTDPNDVYKMMQSIEGLDNIFAVELSFSDNSTSDFILKTIDAGFGKLPLILKIPVESIHSPWINKLEDFPFIEAISLHPPKGIINKSGKYFRGRLFGPGILPITANAISELKKLNIPILGGAGVTQINEINGLFALGLYGFQFYELGWTEQLAE